jgi:Cu/Ag efflux protein CusF
MKIKISVLSLLFLFTFFGCSKEAAKVKKPELIATSQVSPSPLPTASIPKDGDYPAKGIVKKINMDAGSVEIDHEKIEGMMDAMDMEFYVKDKTMLKGLSVGDKVDFVLQYKHPSETVISIKNAQ